MPDLKYHHSLFLNDHDDSELGESTFLDPASTGAIFRPAYLPDTTFPNGTIAVLGRFGDRLSEKRFGVELDSMIRIAANERYEIIWSTPPGDDHDNGNIKMALQGVIVPECALFVAPWGLAPIPTERGSKLVFQKSDYELCFSFRHDVLIPVANWLDSFGRDEE